jgi:CheY-like chemotaxis protein
MTTLTTPEPALANNPARGDVSTILVVDDSRVSRLVAGRVLEKAGGWCVVFAGDGIEAVAAVERDSPRAVLTDLHMPRLDGLGLVELMRTRFPRIPVILMTSTEDDAVAQTALRAGAAAAVRKHELAEELVGVLDRVLAADR